MAPSNVKRRKKRSGKDSDAPLVPTQRKKEVFGLILMVVALLLAIALVTYTATDDRLGSQFTLSNALDPGEDVAQNALGLVGATLAWLLVKNFLGYPTLILTATLFAWGYGIFRQKVSLYLPFLTVLSFVWAIVVACLFGWIDIIAGSSWSTWSGAVGLGTAGWMKQVFGTVGSLLLLVAVVAVTALLTFDRDVQRSLDRLEDGMRGLRAWLARRWTAFREGRADRKRRRAEDRVARRLADDEKRRLRHEQQAAGFRHAPGDAAGARTPPPHERRPGDSRATTPPPTPPPRPASSPAAPRGSEGIAPQREESSEVKFSVKERVEVERADRIDREAEVPDDDIDLAYVPPSIDLLDEPEAGETTIDYAELEENKRILLQKLDTYNIEITEINAIVGPTVTLYELTPAPGIKISKITALEDDLAMAMAARGIRMIAPIPGKSAIGVEIPNRHRELVRVRDVIGTATFRDTKMELPIPLGKTIEGEVYMLDLARLPHLLIAGATGSGKSVGINALVTGLLYACHPANLKFVMIDPKKIELQQYELMVDHYVAMPEDASSPIITDFVDALGVLRSCEREMEQRYDLLSMASVRGIKDYNKKLQDGALNPALGHRHLPYVVVIVDELADLMMTAGKDIEGPIARLAQMARAVGIHLVLATQRPSVDVITGLIKANFPARVAYQVASKIDSRTILDQNGAEGLVGNGDLLFMMGSRIARLQGPFVSIGEVDRIMDHVAGQIGHGPYMLPPADDEDTVDHILGVEDTDELFEEAARIIVRNQQGSVSLLQRKLSVGYTRAARIVDQLEEAGIVGPFVGSKAREVLVDDEQQLDALLKEQDERDRA